MRFAGSFLPLAVTLALGAGCATSFDVRTMTAPKVALTEFRTFHLLPTPRRQRADLAGGAYDPMVSNSITNRALRASVQSAFENRGYVDVELMPDFVVAVYASARTKLDLTQWQFTYSWQPGWSLGVPPYASEYQEGSVIVDVINPQTLDLLWRGSATATLGDNPEENTKLLQKAAVAIVEKFPRATARNLVAQR